VPYGLYISAEGAMAQSKRLEVIANNLANVDTVGFKRDLALFQARYAEATEQGNDYHGSGTINNIGGGVQIRETRTDFVPGPMQSTDGATDLAIEGEGFFVVDRDGQEFLTRAGNFRFSPTGTLETASGDTVLSTDRSPVIVDPTQGPWSFRQDGALEQAGVATFLALVKPDALTDLVKVGENLFQSLNDPEPLDATQRRVKPGHLERSGVRPTLEMMNMIEASRAFEANITLIKNQDDMLGSLINRVLRSA